MKVLIAISCLLAVASAGHLGFTAYSYPYAYGTQHIPVIGANGVPFDEPAVAAAKVEHAAAHAEATARSGNVAVVAPYTYGAHVAAPVVYAGPQHIPVIGANGVPVDEPAVAAARANHAAAHVEAKVRNGDAAVVAAPVATYAAHVAAPAVPLDTPEVAAAKAAHFAAHVEAKVRNGAFHHYAPLVHYRKRRGLFHGYSAAPFAAYTAPFAHFAHYSGAQHIPVIGANGVPVDEPAVAAARAEHAAAHVEAAARNGNAHVADDSTATNAAYVAGPVSHYSGPQHMPVIGANGVPVDEPAVAAARAEHAAAHVEAAARSGDGHVADDSTATNAAYVAGPVSHYSGPQHMPVIGANGVPVDEPAVSAARANHAAAHVEAKARNGDAAVVAAGHFASPVAYSAGHFASPVAYTAGHFAAPVVHYAGAQHVPVIGANGVPVDEPAVAVARAHHAAAHVEAKVRNGDLHHFVAPFVHAW